MLRFTLINNMYVPYNNYNNHMNDLKMFNKRCGGECGATTMFPLPSPSNYPTFEEEYFSADKYH